MSNDLMTEDLLTLAEAAKSLPHAPTSPRSAAGVSAGFAEFAYKPC